MERFHSDKSLVRVQEFNLEKLHLLETEKQRIRKEYERKEAQVEAQKKMCVAIDCMHESVFLMKGGDRKPRELLQIMQACACILGKCIQGHEVHANRI
jgi:hypothetical protein